MPSICSARPHRAVGAFSPFTILAPYIAPPPPPHAQRIPVPPDVLDPDGLEDEDLDLPMEDDPDTGSTPPEDPEEGPGDAEGIEDIRRRRNGTEDEDAWPTVPEKWRKSEVDGPVPEPETHRPRPRLH